MMTIKVLLGFSLYALLVVATHGFPAKGSKSQDQESRDSNAGGNFGSQRTAATGSFAYLPYSVSRDISRPVQGSSVSQSGDTGPAVGGLSSMPEEGYPVTGGPFVPVQAGYVGSTQTGAAQPGLPETKWSIEPKIFSEEGMVNQDFQSSDFVHSPSGPVLQSGEASNVVKEAETGNYKHETEEIGYPAEGMVPGQGSANILLPPFVGGIWGYPSSYLYPDFDYRLLYGLYPPGTYSTFSKLDEKGKDYFQDIHYLKDHGSDASGAHDNSGSDQQKLFMGAL